MGQIRAVVEEGGRYGIIAGKDGQALLEEIERRHAAAGPVVVGRGDRSGNCAVEHPPHNVFHLQIHAIATGEVPPLSLEIDRAVGNGKVQVQTRPLPLFAGKGQRIKEDLSGRTFLRRSPGGPAQQEQNPRKNPNHKPHREDFHQLSIHT